jgi:hypothetical protein
VTLRVLRVFALLLVAYAAFCLLLWWGADRIIFQPPSPGYEDGPEIVRLPTAEGDTVAALHLPNPRADFTVLFAHGNAEDVGWSRPYFEELRRAGFSVLAFDYPGYGTSTGRPSERGAYAAADAAYEHLTRTLGIPPQRIIVHGRSLGGAVAVELVRRRPAAGLVLESTFTSAVGVLPERIVPFDRFTTLGKLGDVRLPTLVIHGRRDEVVGFAHGERIHAALGDRAQAFWVDGAGHNDLAFVADTAYWQRLRSFADGLRRESTADGAPRP